MSIDDLRRVVGYRVVQDARLMNGMMAVVKLRQSVSDCEGANKALKRTIRNNDEAIASLQDQRDKQRERAEKAERKARRRNPVTFLLIGAVGGFIINNSLP